MQKKSAAKRPRMDLEEGEISDGDEMEQDAQNMGESSSGGATEAGQGISHSSIIPHKHLPALHFSCKRNMRFSFINSVEDTSWSVSGTNPNYTLQFGSDFFEIPHNHMCFYLPPNVQGFVGAANAYKIRNPSWRISNLQFIAAQENVVPGTTPPQTFEMQGNANFTIDTLYNPSVQPPGRLRIYNYDGYGRQRAGIGNTAATVNGFCANAESGTQALPLVQWQAPANAASDTFSTPQMYRWCRNHKLDSKIGCSPKFISGWRRTIPAQNQAWNSIPVASPWPDADAPVENSAAPKAYKALPAWSSIASSLSNDIIGSDCKDRHYTYYDNSKDKLVQHVNPDFFMRIRDPPRWGTGATAGSNNNDPASQLAIKCVVDIETDIDIELTLDCLNNDVAANVHNDNRWMSRNFSVYAPMFYSTTVVTNPGGAPTVMPNELNDAPIDTPIVQD